MAGGGRGRWAAVLQGLVLQRCAGGRRCLIGQWALSSSCWALVTRPVVSGLCYTHSSIVFCCEGNTHMFVASSTIRLLNVFFLIIIAIIIEKPNNNVLWRFFHTLIFISMTSGLLEGVFSTQHKHTHHSLFVLYHSLRSYLMDLFQRHFMYCGGNRCPKTLHREKGDSNQGKQPFPQRHTLREVIDNPYYPVHLLPDWPW